MFSKRVGIHVVLIIACLAIIVMPRIHQEPDPDKAAAATATATQFLELVDADQFASSWSASADLLKQKVTKEEWVEKLSRLRTVAGPLVERRSKDVSYSTAAKESPDGEYIKLVFDSNFQKKENATETVTVMLEEDSRWRVAGYFIQ